jgi:hypothetical protein
VYVRTGGGEAPRSFKSSSLIRTPLHTRTSATTPLKRRLVNLEKGREEEGGGGMGSRAGGRKNKGMRKVHG